MNSSTRTPFSYVVLRYVHDIATGEFINVGVVVLASGAGFLGAKFKTTYGRVKKTFPSIDAESFRSRMRRLQTTFDSIAEGDINRPLKSAIDVKVAENEPQLGSVRASGRSPIQTLVYSVIRPDDSSFQWAAPGSGVSKDLAATVETLYQRFVTRYDTDGNAQQRKDDDVWKHFRVELEKRNVLFHFQEKVIAVADDSVKFDHAWKNSAWHCYEPLSFDLASDASIKEKAHRWLGQVQSIKDAPEGFNVYFLVGKPTEENLHGAYEKALSILRKAPSSKVVEESEAAAFSDSVAKAITEHDQRPL